MSHSLISKELDFDEFTPELKEFLEAYRASEKSKKEAKSRASSGKSKAVEEAGGDTENDAATPPAKKARLDEPSRGAVASSLAKNGAASDEENADHEHDKDDEANDQAGDDVNGKEEDKEKALAESEPVEE